MKFQPSLLSQLVMGTFVAAISVASPVSYAGFEIVGNPNTPYVYQLSSAPRKVIDVHEERVLGATANTLHRGHPQMDLVMIPVAANKGVDMLTGLRGIVPESQGWRVYALKGVNTRSRVEWNQSDNWLTALDGLLLRHKLIAEISWANREITLAPLSNKSYAAQLRNQAKELGIVRQVLVRKQYETPDPLLALRLQPAQAAHTEARSVAVNTIEVPVRAVSEFAERPSQALSTQALPAADIEQLVNQRVEQATRERLVRLEALEAQYREKLEQLNQQAKKNATPGLTQPAANSTSSSPISLQAQVPQPDTKPQALSLPAESAHVKPADSARLQQVSLRHEVFDDEEVVDAVQITPAPPNVSAQLNRSNVNSGVVPAGTASEVSLPLQTGLEVQQAPRTKWEVSLQDKTLRNALSRMAARNGYSLSYQTQDQDILAPGSYYGTFDEALRELELVSGKRIRTIESKLLGRLIIVTD